AASVTFQKLTVTTAQSVDNPGTGNRPVSDMVFDPSNTNNLVVGVEGTNTAGDGGIYRSTNALAAGPAFTQVLTTSTGGARFLFSANQVGTVVTIYAASGEACTVACGTGNSGVV